METPDQKPRHSIGALILLVIDLMLAICVCIQVGFMVPVFGAVADLKVL